MEPDEIIGDDVELAFFADGHFGHKVGVRLRKHLIRIEDLDWLVSFNVPCHTRDEHGFPTPDEVISLQTVADRALPLMHGPNSRSFLRSTSDGIRSYWSYVKDGPSICAKIDALYADYAEYKIYTKCKHDPQWTFYFQEVDPIPAFELEKQALLAVLQLLNQQGDSLSVPRQFDHSLRFATLEGAQEFKHWALNRGFKCGDPYLVEDKALGHFVDISREEQLDWKFVNGTLYELVFAAARFGGIYSANGCVPVIDTMENL